jgi:membrane associated rhomboid family serine protease
MGIYDREYYRRDGPGFLRYFSEHGRVCKWLIGINVVVFIAQTLTGGDQGLVTEAFDLSARDLLNGEVWRLLTAAFLHGGIWHIVFNMLLLWWAGAEMEDLYGPWEFLAFYLVAAVVGNLAQVGYYAVTYGFPFDPSIPRGALSAIGASGAVMGVIVLYAFHYPFRRILVFFVLPMPVWLAVVLAVAVDVLGLQEVGGGIAVACHLGGAAFGALYYWRHWRLLQLWNWLRSRRPTRPRLRVYREEEVPAPRAPVAVAAAPRSDVDEHLEAKLDEVLEKVARFGQDSLTESERQILFRASEVYKKRRS